MSLSPCSPWPQATERVRILQRAKRAVAPRASCNAWRVRAISPYFPKKTRFLKVSQHEVNDALYLLNHRPRVCLGYRTPHEVFYGLKMQPITLPFVALCT